MDEVERSKHFISHRFEWVIDESTLQVLDAERGAWIARVSTTHLAESDRSFVVLVKGYEHFILEENMLPNLGRWLAKREE